MNLLCGERGGGEGEGEGEGKGEGEGERERGGGRGRGGGEWGKNLRGEKVVENVRKTVIKRHLNNIRIQHLYVRVCCLKCVTHSPVMTQDIPTTSQVNRPFTYLSSVVNGTPLLSVITMGMSLNLGPVDGVGCWTTTARESYENAYNTSYIKIH